MRERDHLEDLGVDERIILKWISRCGGHTLFQNVGTSL
jgi:hypothetical protein